METRTLYIIRGLPGSGKTTFATRFFDIDLIFSADDYFTNSKGEYNFDASKIKDAHEYCQRSVEATMAIGWSYVVVHNTFSQRWELEPYLKLALKYEYRIFILETQNDFGTIHGVPQEKISQMELRWEPLVRKELRLRQIIKYRFKRKYQRLKSKLLR